MKLIYKFSIKILLCLFFLCASSAHSQTYTIFTFAPTVTYVCLASYENITPNGFGKAVTGFANDANTCNQMAVNAENSVTSPSGNVIALPCTYPGGADNPMNGFPGPDDLSSIPNNRRSVMPIQFFCGDTPNGYGSYGYAVFTCPNIAVVSKLNSAPWARCEITITKTQNCQKCRGVGDPIDPASGTYFSTETDYANNKSGLKFVRTLTVGDTTYPHWSNNHQMMLQPSSTDNRVLAYRPDGAFQIFLPSTSAPGTYTSDADTTDTLTLTANGWTYRDSSDDHIEYYSAQGQLLSITNRNGVQFVYGYTGSPSQYSPTVVTDSFGQTLHFEYDSQGRMTAMIDPAGNRYIYTYDGPSILRPDAYTPNHITSVTYPGGAVKTYWYNESAQTPAANDALTGITDENGVSVQPCHLYKCAFTQ